MVMKPNQAPGLGRRRTKRCSSQLTPYHGFGFGPAHDDPPSLVPRKRKKRKLVSIGTWKRREFTLVKTPVVMGVHDAPLAIRSEVSKVAAAAAAGHSKINAAPSRQTVRGAAATGNRG